MQKYKQNFKAKKLRVNTRKSEVGYTDYKKPLNENRGIVVFKPSSHVTHISIYEIVPLP